MSTRLTRGGHLLLVLLAMFAFGAVTAAAAQAEEAPRWVEGGKKLKLGENREIKAKATENLKLEAGGKVVECEKAGVKAGSQLEGTEAGVPGKSEEVIEFSGNCRITGNGSPCSVKEPIVTKPVRNEIVENTARTTYLVEFDPAAGTTKEFVTLEFTGTGCEVTSTKVGEGLVVGELFTDPATGEPQPVGPTSHPEAKSFLIKFPDAATEVFLFTEGTGKNFALTSFRAFGKAAKLTGTVLVELANGNAYGAEG